LGKDELNMEDKLDKLYGQFMDSVLDLATELSERENVGEELTTNELNFLNTFDAYLIEMEQLSDEEENN
jgi:hypothetical protein